ncbi:MULTISPECIES: amino acid permease [unclassified Streptomyces]|uniref:amino acid permease n=1 Tax=unclassified Streptomyces TaxID=2593676 RepID=UPI002DD7F2D6|nr:MULTISPECIES: amino acid permease [unclassified Streptomyces]WSC40869.1 amino acid permease [Streptomyces sp. NBC_01763]WSC52023.1 amino acid permease [Streptomyces sp. NBC_01761]WSF82871.1 amino acid permease [Streptomyces sp. NBC_01744]
MAYGLARRELRPRVPLRPGEGERHHLTSIEGLAALSLDALSSVAYGPEAIVLVLIAAGTGALTATLPVTLVIAALLGLMLIGLAVLIRRDHVAPRGGVTVLAQLTAGSYGTGWPYYTTNLIVTLALAFAANTSFGGLPVLMSLLAKDHRLPHLFGLRRERPVYRWGVVALALLAALLLIAVNADTHRMIPLFAIGVFIGFTISQVGLVRHWARERPSGWVRRAVLNGVGAILTTVAGIVLLTTKFLEGAWVVVAAVPLLMLLFARIQRYYTAVGRELGLGEVPPPVRVTDSLVIVPVGEVSKLTQHALTAARSLGHEVVAVAVHGDPAKARALEESWDRWDPGVRLDVIDSPQRSLVQPIVDYVRRAAEGGRQIAVLIPEVEPLHRRYQILQNQRGLLLAAALRARTDVVVCVVPYRLSL